MLIILVAEDDDMSRDMLCRRLAKLGYVVIEARNGTEAIDAARTEAPDLILMDVCMPMMDGRHRRTASAERRREDRAHSYHRPHGAQHRGRRPARHSGRM